MKVNSLTAAPDCPVCVSADSNAKVHLREGDQDMPPQNMPPWHKNYFEKAIENQELQQQVSAVPSSTWKPGINLPLEEVPTPTKKGRGAHHQRQTDNTNTRLQEQTLLKELLPSISFPHIFPSHSATTHHPLEPKPTFLC